jgi:hypothetical protein
VEDTGAPTREGVCVQTIFPLFSFVCIQTNKCINKQTNKYRYKRTNEQAYERKHKDKTALPEKPFPSNAEMTFYMIRFNLLFLPFL